MINFKDSCKSKQKYIYGESDVKWKEIPMGNNLFTELSTFQLYRNKLEGTFIGIWLLVKSNIKDKLTECTKALFRLWK